jgi:ribonuclease BN (tRNA processing enzyme)
MRLTTVGTGTAAPHAARVQAGHLVETSDASLMLDCGSGVAFRLAELSIDWTRITHVALSHFHADHVLDLPTLLVAWRYGTLPARSAPIEIIGPPGTAAMVDRVTEALGIAYRDYGFEVIVHEIEFGGTLDLGARTSLQCFKVPHTEESVAYSVASDGQRLVYTGDTAYDENWARWAEGCDLLLCECSLPSSMAVPSHLTPEQVGALAAVAKPTVLALTHLYPPVERVDIRALVAAHYAGAVVVAFDGWRTDL